MSLIVATGVGIGKKTMAKVKINGVGPTCYIDLMHGTNIDIIFYKKIKLF
jgi:hypothetical protein